MKKRPILLVLATGIATMIVASVVHAYTVTQQYDPVAKTYTYKVVVGASETPVRDFHLRARKGQKIKVGTVANPRRSPNPQTDPPTPSTEMTGWNHTSVGSGATVQTITWSTTQAAASTPPDPTKDPVGPGNEINFQFKAGPGASVGWLYFRVTTDGSNEWIDPIPGDVPPPKPPVTTPPSVPGPIAAVVPTIPDDTPTPNSTQALTLTSSEPGTEWRVVLSTVLTGEEGIGITMTNPPAHNIQVTPSTGTFTGGGSATAQLQVGAAPSGYKFYLVLIGYEGGEIDLFDGPYEITVTP